MSALRPVVEELFKAQRGNCARILGMLDRSQEFLEKLPDDVLGLCCFSDCWLQICGPTRAQVEVILSVAGAGKWTKEISTGDPAKLDYEGEVNGVKIIIYRSAPPPSCRIVTREVFVPEHVETVRELICS